MNAAARWKPADFDSVQLLMPIEQRGHWVEARDGDLSVLSLFKRHYSFHVRADGTRTRKFTGPGEHMVLRTQCGRAIWLWRLERYRQDGREGVNCAIFRNESGILSSDLIREASALAAERWPGMPQFTFVDARRIRSSNAGYCYQRAGWAKTGKTKGGLVVLERAA